MEEIEESRALLYVLLPDGVLELFTDLYEVFEKVLPEIFANFVLNPHWHEIQLYVHVHADCHSPANPINWLIYHHEILILQLNIFLIYLAFIT